MALQFDVKCFSRRTVSRNGDRAAPARQTSPAENSANSSGSGRAFAFFGAHLHAGDQAAQILIAGAIFGQQRITDAIGASDFGADVRANAGLFCGHVEARGAGDVVAVENRQGGEVELGGSGRPVLRAREDPSRKLKAERAWSSTYGLVIAAFDEPAALWLGHREPSTYQLDSR